MSSFLYNIVPLGLFAIHDSVPFFLVVFLFLRATTTQVSEDVKAKMNKLTQAEKGKTNPQTHSSTKVGVKLKIL